MKFYGHFAAAYGTIWLVLMGSALLTQSHIDAGEFGLFGFPIAAAGYAFYRQFTADSHSEVERLQQRVAQLESDLARHENG